MHEFVEAFKFIARNGAIAGDSGVPTLTQLTLETLRVAAIGVGISVAIAVPVGVWLGHVHRGSFVAINLGNIGRALPSLAVPPIITNAYLGVDGVDRDLVDAARGMGMSEREILTRVELPLAVPLIFAGIRTAAVFVVSTPTIASLAGFSGSLGDIIANET